MFQTCSRPIHQWLLVSYACVIAFRMMHLFVMQMSVPEGQAPGGSESMTAANFLLDLRHKDLVPRIVVSFTWAAALPFFVLWTVIGTVWMWQVMRETPNCVPTVTHLWFSGFWLALCYVWLIIHAALGIMAWVLERRVRRAEGDLQAIEDADVVSRWGQVSQLSGYRSLTSAQNQGLSPAEIKDLPTATAFEHCGTCGGKEDGECSICLNELKPSDQVRCLPPCGHLFHRSCIDLWLLRRADCPLCKRSVRGESVA